MAFFTCNFYSEVLGVCATMNVVLPQKTRSQIGVENETVSGKHPTLYLLHGLSDDHSIWMRHTSIERYAVEKGLAVVMPAVNRSFYTDMENGYPYWTFVSEEVPALARSFFPLSDLREDNFVAGLSMGGYGALKLALRKPECFCAAASLSGAVDAAAIAERREDLPDLRLIFGDKRQVAGSDDDLFHLIEKIAASNGPRPLIYQCCGTEDFLYQDNVKFRKFAEEHGVDITYEEDEGEAHTWSYWDVKIRRVLDWLPLKK